MRILTIALTGAALMTAPAALAQGMDKPAGLERDSLPSGENPFEPSSFDDPSRVFRAADLDDNGAMSRAEFSMLRNNLVDDSWLRDYRGDQAKDLAPTVARTYARFDADNDGAISKAEFVSTVQTAPAGANWDWDPEYMTVTYYLTANPIDADKMDHQPVVNLEGERIGKIENIIRNTDNNEYYAMIDLEGHTLDRYPSYLETDTIGVPLNDVLLFEEGRSLVLTSRGDEHLRDVDARKIDNWEEVETLYSL